MPRRSLDYKVLKATGKLSNNQRRRLQKVILDQGELYNTTLEALGLNHTAGKDLELQDLEKQLTQVRREYPTFQSVHRRVSMATLKRAITAWNRHTQPKENDEPRGKPRHKAPERFRTISIETPPNPIIRFTEASHPFLCIKGLPSIQLKGHREFPADKQPNTAIITLKQHEVSIRLVYRGEPYTKTVPVKELSNPLGVDLGITAAMATSNGILYTSPNEEKLTQEIKAAQNKLSRKISAAIRLGAAVTRARLDGSNNQDFQEGQTPIRGPLARATDIWLPQVPAPPPNPTREKKPTQARLQAPDDHGDDQTGHSRRERSTGDRRPTDCQHDQVRERHRK